MSKKKSTATRRAESQAASVRAAEIRAAQERKERRRRTLVVTVVGVAVLAIVLVLVHHRQRETRHRKRRRLAAHRRDRVRRTGRPGVGAGEGDGLRGLPVPVLRPVREGELDRAGGRREGGQGAAALPRADLPGRQHQHGVLQPGRQRARRGARPVRARRGQEVPRPAVREPARRGQCGTLRRPAARLRRARRARPRPTSQPGIKDRTFEQWVKNVSDQASKDGVNQTPTVFVDGKKISRLDRLPRVAGGEGRRRRLTSVPRRTPCLGTNLGIESGIAACPRRHAGTPRTCRGKFG